MLITSHTTRSRAVRGVLPVLLGAMAINALVFSPAGDQGFFAIALFGPLLTGAAAGLMRADRRPPVATWALCGVFWLVLDWAINQEDVLFHAVLTVLMVGLVRLGAAIGGRTVRLRRAARL